MQAGIWELRRKALDAAGVKDMIFEAGHALSVGEVIARWRSDAAFRSAFLGWLAEAPFRGFFWELLPIRHGAVDVAFEHVLIGTNAFDRMQADVAAFRAKFAADEPVVAFDNLGGDATLVVPRPLAGANLYGHIAAFVRTAPPEQQHALLERLACEIDRRLARSSSDLWISTSGLGVPWLHVRLDSVPKYYSHRPYRMGK